VKYDQAVAEADTCSLQHHAPGISSSRYSFSLPALASQRSHNWRKNRLRSWQQQQQQRNGISASAPSQPRWRWRHHQRASPACESRHRNIISSSESRRQLSATGGTRRALRHCRVNGADATYRRACATACCHLYCPSHAAYRRRHDVPTCWLLFHALPYRRRLRGTAYRLVRWRVRTNACCRELAGAAGGSA